MSVETWLTDVIKWKKFGAFEIAFAMDQPLDIWRQIVQHLYNIKFNYKPDIDWT